MTQKLKIFNQENIYLTYSSLSFLVPGFYGLLHKEFILSPLLINGSLISYFFWKDPRYNLQRSLDIYFVNGAALIFGYQSFFKIKNKKIKYTINSLYTMATLCFLNACNYYYQHKPYWFYYHLAFHGCSLVGHSINVFSKVHNF